MPQFPNVENGASEPHRAITRIKWLNTCRGPGAAPCTQSAGSNIIQGSPSVVALQEASAPHRPLARLLRAPPATGLPSHPLSLPTVRSYSPAHFTEGETEDHRVKWFVSLPQSGILASPTPCQGDISVCLLPLCNVLTATLEGGDFTGIQRVAVKDKAKYSPGHRTASTAKNH